MSETPEWVRPLLDEITSTVRAERGQLVGPLQVWHLDGIVWHEAAVPPRWHRCAAQTIVQPVSDPDPLVVCACGAERAEGIWIFRNARRKGIKG